MTLAGTFLANNTRQSFLYHIFFALYKFTSTSLQYCIARNFDGAFFYLAILIPSKINLICGMVNMLAGC